MAGDHDQPVAAARLKGLGVGRAVLTGWAGIVVVLVVAPPRLAPQAARGDGAHGDRRRAPARLAEALLVERARDVQADVDPDQVHQLERPHPEPAPHAADAIDLLERRDALLEQLQRLEAKRPVASVDQEARPVHGDDHVLAHRLAGGPGQSQCRVRGLFAGDHLKQAHDRRRIEEVHADDALGALGSRGDRGDQQRRGVAGKDALVADDAVRQPREQRVLDLQPLGRRLDHQLT